MPVGVAKHCFYRLFDTYDVNSKMLVCINNADWCFKPSLNTLYRDTILYAELVNIWRSVPAATDF